MTDTATPESVVVTVRLPRELVDGIKKSATDNDRNVSAELRRAARQYLEAQGISGKAA